MIDELPAAQVFRYSEVQKRAFLKAFNEAFRRYDGDERRAFATAHAAARRAGSQVAEPVDLHVPREGI